MKRLYRIDELPSIKLKRQFDSFMPEAESKWKLERVCNSGDDISCPAGKYKLVSMPNPHPVSWQSCDNSKELKLGDFVGGPGSLALRREIYEELSMKFKGLDATPIDVIKPKRYTEYFDQKYVKIEAQLEVPIQTTMSTFRASKPCEVCGRASYTLLGIEQLAEDVLNVWPNYRYQEHVPRKPAEGFCVLESVVEGFDFFKGHAFLLCKENVKNYITRRELSNVCFIEYGELI